MIIVFFNFQLSLFIEKLKLGNPFFIFKFPNLIDELPKQRNRDCFFQNLISSFCPQNRKKKFCRDSLKRDRSRNSNEEKYYT